MIKKIKEKPILLWFLAHNFFSCLKPHVRNVKMKIWQYKNTKRLRKFILFSSQMFCLPILHSSLLTSQIILFSCNTDTIYLKKIPIFIFFRFPQISQIPIENRTFNIQIRISNSINCLLSTIPVYPLFVLPFSFIAFTAKTLIN